METGHRARRPPLAGHALRPQLIATAVGPAQPAIVHSTARPLVHFIAMSSDSSSSFTRIVPMALGAVTLGGAAYYVTKLIAERDGGSSSDMKREVRSAPDRAPAAHRAPKREFGTRILTFGHAAAQMASRDEEIRSLRQQVKLLASQTEEVTVDGVSSPAQALEKRRQGKPVRLYMDGCFDMTHFGCVPMTGSGHRRPAPGGDAHPRSRRGPSHANALRQAKSLGDVLVVGIHTDEEISRNKGSPLMNYEERVSMLGSLKWVDEIIRCASEWGRPPARRAPPGARSAALTNAPRPAPATRRTPRPRSG